jgi:hypothetical protein
MTAPSELSRSIHVTGALALTPALWHNLGYWSIQ